MVILGEPFWLSFFFQCVVDTSAETGPPLGHYTILTFNARKEDDLGNFIMTPVEKFSTGTWQRAKSCLIIIVPSNYYHDSF